MFSIRLVAAIGSLLAASGLAPTTHAEARAKPLNPVLASRADGASGAKGNDSSLGSALSGNGRVVAFYSYASNLDPDDTDEVNDAYARDIKTGKTTLVSRADGWHGTKGNASSFDPSVSGDGRLVAFTSTSSNLDPNDSDATMDVYIRNLKTGRTILVSRRTGAHGAKANGLTRWPTISANGRFVLFNSTATNLDPRDTDPALDVYVRDLKLGTTTLVSRGTGRDGDKGNGSSTGSSITPDGRYVAFRSTSSNLDPDDTEDPAGETALDVYVRDLTTERTILASRGDGLRGAKGNNRSNAGSLSPDGRLLAFESLATNLDPDDTDANDDIYVRDLKTGQVDLVSRADGLHGANANGVALIPHVGDNGRLIEFQSLASNLDPDDPDAIQDIYVRDLTANNTILVSRSTPPVGSKSNADSRGPSISAAARTVAFQSLATNLHPEDADVHVDTYVTDLSHVR